MRSSQALSCVGTVKLYIGAPITKMSAARNASSASSPASLLCGPSGPPTRTRARGWSDGSRSSTSDLTHVFRRSNCDAVALRQAGKEAALGVWCPGHRRADPRYRRCLRNGQHRPPLHLRQMPGLGSGVVAVPDLKSRGIAGAAAGDIEAPTRLRVYQAVLLSPAPLLGTGAIAVPELNWRPIGGAAAGDVHAVVQDTQCPIAAAPAPALRTRGITRPDLDRSAVVRACTGIIDAHVAIAADRSRASVFRFDH